MVCGRQRDTASSIHTVGTRHHPSTLAIRSSGGVADVVFSVVDGKVVKPAMPQGTQLGRAVVYQGGFGYEYTVAGDYTTDRVAFFDETGKMLSEPGTEGRLENRSLDVPIVGSKSKNLILALAGQQIL